MSTLQKRADQTLIAINFRYFSPRSKFPSSPMGRNECSTFHSGEINCHNYGEVFTFGNRNHSSKITPIFPFKLICPFTGFNICVHVGRYLCFTHFYSCASRFKQLLMQWACLLSKLAILELKATVIINRLLQLKCLYSGLQIASCLNVGEFSNEVYFYFSSLITWILQYYLTFLFYFMFLAAVLFLSGFLSIQS